MEKFLALNEIKQKTIINAALQCFGRHGYEKASVNDIATAAQISKASVFQYFGSKIRLYEYLLDYSKQAIMESFPINETGEQEDLFDRVLSSSLMETDILKKNPYLSQFIAGAWTESAEDVQNTLIKFRDDASKFRKDFVLKKNDAEKFKNPEDAEIVFQILMMMAEGYASRFQKEEHIEYDLVMAEFQNMLEAMRRNFYKEEYLI